MNRPVFDPRDREDIRAQIAALAASYTPEWRYETAEDDPGAALAELFAEMFHQTVDRMNAVPEKLYLSFLHQIGYREPDSAPAYGTMRFTPHDSVDEPVPVPAGTQVFTPDEMGENIVYETVQGIQATAARLLDLYFLDGDADEIRRMDLSRPRSLFYRLEGEPIQRHRFSLGQNQVLLSDRPCVIRVQIRQKAQFMEEQTARILTADALTWSYCHDGAQIPFDEVREDHGVIFLEKRNNLSMDPDPEGHVCVTCQGRPEQDVALEQAIISSEPLEDCPVRRMFSDDLPIYPEEGGYCFGRQPEPYSLFYLRSDTVLSKRKANAVLKLSMTHMVNEPPRAEVRYDYGNAIIDKRGAVERKPDDVYVSGVIWEYFNGLGWRSLEVSGSRNPFSGKQDRAAELTFQIPEDLEETEVNAETGLYIRARVTTIENQFTDYGRRIIPFLTGASMRWQYEEGLPVDWVRTENNGGAVEIGEAESISSLDVTILSALPREEQSVYLRFDRSPHAMPLSLRFWMQGWARMEEKLLWEAEGDGGFEPVQCLDQTENLLHTGEIMLYLPNPLPERERFGVTGYWLRVRRTSRRAGPLPRVRQIETNTVTAVQLQRHLPQVFNTGVYEAGKTVVLLNTPVQNCRVWLDERSRLSEEEAARLAGRYPGRVRLEVEEHQLVRCWVLWDRIDDLALASPEDRVYVLDPYDGSIRFGDGRTGRVPPEGDRNILVEYASGGGERGNVPAGAVNAPVGGLPLISDVENLTAMSGGTSRLTLEQIKARGNRRLRHRDRAAGIQDYEDIVMERFPQVRHVRCCSGVNAAGQREHGAVTVVLDSYGEQEERLLELAQRVYEELSRRASCCLVAEGRLQVRPAVRVTVNTTVTVELERMDQAAESQQEIETRLRNWIETVWKQRPIGSQIRLSEIWSVVRETENVRLIRRILVEGRYDEAGQTRLIPLEGDMDLPFAVVENGVHQVKLQ